jgi:hypothetical protein
LHFSKIEDPRIERTKRHKLIDILTIAILAVICGADSWVAMASFGQAKLKWLKRILELPNGIPSHDTFARVFARLNPEQLQQCFLEWVQALVLGQCKVDEKSNEITAIPQLLRVLEISGCVVTIDAMGCQKEIARLIVERDAHYVLALLRQSRQSV